MAICSDLPPGRVGGVALELTRASLFAVILLLGVGVFAPSNLICIYQLFPKYRYLQRSRPCPGGVSRPRSYQSIAIYNDPAPAQGWFPTLEATKVSLRTVIPP